MYSVDTSEHGAEYRHGYDRRAQIDELRAAQQAANEKFWLSMTAPNWGTARPFNVLSREVRPPLARPGARKQQTLRLY